MLEKKLAETINNVHDDDSLEHGTFDRFEVIILKDTARYAS